MALLPHTSLETSEQPAHGDGGTVHPCAPCLSEGLDAQVLALGRTWPHLADLFGGERERASEQRGKDTGRNSELGSQSHSVTLTCSSREAG